MKTKEMIAILLVILTLSISTIALTSDCSKAADTSTFNNTEGTLKYTVISKDTSKNTGTVSVSGISGINGSVLIPSTVYNDSITYTVVKINNNGFSGKEITSITIPSSIISIGNSAFNACNTLKSVQIDYGVTTIGDSAFRSCKLLESINLPDSITFISTYAFTSCESLTSITIPSNLTSISSSTFSSCKNLSSVTLPLNLTSIESSAFSGCKKLTLISLPSNLESIGSDAFSSSGLITITITSKVYSIGANALSNCTSLANVIIEDGVISIGHDMCNGCTSLQTVTIPSSVTSIGNNAFFYCIALKSVSVPSSTTSIGENVFGYCLSFSSVLYNTDSTMLIYCPPSKYGNFEIPSTVKIIASGAFYGSNLTSITIPSSVTSIGSSAFYKCSKLTSIAIPSGITSIEDYTFYSCSKLTSITIPSSVTSIGNSAFCYCSGLTSVVFFGQPSNIEEYSFYVNTNNKCTIWSTGWASTTFNSTITYGSILIFSLLYTVTFDSNGGSSVPNQMVCENTCATLPSSTMTGYSLSGWFTDLSSSTPYNFNDPIMSNLTLYAIWTANKYTVTTSEGTGTTINLSGTYAQYGNDYSFGVNSNTGYDRSTPLVTVLIGSTTYTNLTNIDNAYTIHGTDIINEITIVTYDLSPNLYSISGTLTTSNESSPAGVTVTLTSGSDKYTAITDSEGKYILNNVPYGTSGNIVANVEHYHQNAVLSISVSGDAFNENINLDLDSYIVTWENYNGTILKTDSVDCGNIPVYSGSTPQKNATSSYYYDFSGWSPAISAVIDNITYTATFDSTLRSYTVSISSSTYGLFSGAGIYQVGDTVTIDFTTGSQHYIIEQWNADGAVVLSQTSNSLTFTMPASNTTVSYTIIKDPSVKECEISYINLSSVSITPDPNTLDEGTVESFTVESTTDCTSLTVTVRDSTNTIIYQGTFTDTDADGVITGTFTITMTDNITIELLSNKPTNSDIDLSNNIVRIVLILFIIFLIFLGYIIYSKYVRPRLIEKRDKQDDDQSP